MQNSADPQSTLKINGGTDMLLLALRRMSVIKVGLLGFSGDYTIVVRHKLVNGTTKLLIRAAAPALDP